MIPWWLRLAWGAFATVLAFSTLPWQPALGLWIFGVLVGLTWAYLEDWIKENRR